ncbi:MAG: right-handed parallel beta-helix repeat-containing protein [Candidatus Limnocylindrales bacterium]
MFSLRGAERTSGRAGWHDLARTSLMIVLFGVASAIAVSACTPTPDPITTRTSVLVSPHMPTPTPTPTSILVPTSIDATGASDASAALQSWLGSVPDGSTIIFRAGGTYRMDKGLQIFPGRQNLTLDGNGATLRSNGDATSASSLFIVSGTDITIRDFDLVGNSPTPGTYLSGHESANGVLTYGATNVEIANVTISGVYGDGLMVDGWSDNVRFHDSHVVSAGRNGVSILAGKNVTVERVVFDESGWATFDIEPSEASGGASNVQFLANTVGTWNGRWGFFFGADGAAGSVISGVTVSGNTITGSPLTTYVDLARRQNVVFTNNTSSVVAPGPVLNFAHVDGLTVTGNFQPLSSGVLATITDSTGVTYP